MNYFIPIIFAALIFLAVIIIFNVRKFQDNKKHRLNNVLIPFSGKLQPPGSNRDPSSGTALLRTTGAPQISCPTGSKVNIVGAWIEVYDPYGECTNSPLPTFLNTCGIPISDPTKQISCSAASDCAAGQDCKNNICVPITCSANSDCVPADGSLSACASNNDQSGDDGPCMACVNSKCVQRPTCQNINGSGQNVTCANGACRKRDASAWLANKCDGQQSCLDTDEPWNPSDPNSGFGPLPCNIKAPSPADGKTSYYSLPIVPGWDAKQKDSDGSAHKNSFSQGYYVHGIFSCIPDEE